MAKKKKTPPDPGKKKPGKVRIDGAMPEKDTDPLPEPWGTVVDGEPGISAARLAKALGVTPVVVKGLASPIGMMKQPYRNKFRVYDPTLVQTLDSHPEVLKGRARRSASRSNSAREAMDARRKRCIDTLVSRSGRVDLWHLYATLVEKLWSPSSERSLNSGILYARLPSILWDALDVRDGSMSEADKVISDIIWSMAKERTWKVNKLGDQDAPLVWRIWEEKLTVDEEPEIFGNVFVAAIRHTLLVGSAGSKYELRLRAINKLREISKRKWPQFG